MKSISLKQHKFDEIMRLLTVITLVVFSLILTFIKSDLSRDIILLIIGIIGGKYIKV